MCTLELCGTVKNSSIKDHIRSLRRFLRGPEVSQKKIAAFLQQFENVPSLPRAAEDLATLAIVVPCYGHARYLDKMFESIVSQTRPADEVVLVNDCSPDNSDAILERLLCKLPTDTNTKFSLLHNETNRGQAYSINREIGRAHV